MTVLYQVRTPCDETRLVFHSHLVAVPLSVWLASQVDIGDTTPDHRPGLFKCTARVWSVSWPQLTPVYRQMNFLCPTTVMSTILMMLISHLCRHLCHRKTIVLTSFASSDDPCHPFPLLKGVLSDPPWCPKQTPVMARWTYPKEDILTIDYVGLWLTYCLPCVLHITEQ